MRKSLVTLPLIAAMGLGACEDMTRDERILLGGLTGAAVGLVAADALDADSGWTILAVLTGAAIGTLVARNQRTGECAYAAGGGRYRIERCR